MRAGEASGLLAIAARVRAFLQPAWLQWHGVQRPAVPSTGTCGRSSLFLTSVLRAAGHDDAEWCCGAPGDHAAAEGYHDGTGWRGHAWVGVAGHVLDITADQFGQPPVLLLPAPDPRYRRGPDRADPQAVAARAEAVRALWAEAVRSGQFAAPS